LKESLREKKGFLSISLLIIFQFLFYFFTILFFYIPYFGLVSEAYSTFYYLPVLTVIIIIKILVFLNLVKILFQKWVSHEEPHYSDIPFLLGFSFYMLISAKLIDFVLYTTYAITIHGVGFNELFLLNLTKFRYILVLIELLPPYLIGIYLYFFRKNLGTRDLKLERIARKNTVIFSIIYILTVSIIIILLQTIAPFTIIAGIISLISLSFVVWMFITMYRGKILPEFNSLIISIGFFFYLIFNILFPILMYSIAQASIEGEAVTTITIEGGTLVSAIIILIGFKTKARYKV